MTGISQEDGKPTNAPSREEIEGSTEEHSQRKGVDWPLILLSMAAVMALSAGLTLGLVLALASPFGINLQLLKVNYTPLAFIVDNLNLLQLILLLIICFLLIALLSYWFVRRRVLGKQFLLPAAGCPSCGHENLRRIRRQRRDRMFSWIGIPVARYNCELCSWNGVRIRKGLLVSSNSDDWARSMAAAAELDKSVTHIGASSIVTAESGLETDLVTDGGRAKWVARLSAPVEFAALDLDETIGQAKPAAGEADRAMKETAAAAELSGNRGLVPSYALYIAREAGRTAIGENQAADVSPDPQTTEGEAPAPFGLNLGVYPQEDGAILIVVDADSQALPLDKEILEEGLSWQRVSLDEGQGWTLSAFVRRRD